MDGEFSDVDRCLVIIGSLEDECSRRLQKVRLREVCAAASSIPRKLKWASTLLALLKYPFYPLFILDNGMNLISKSLTVLTPA